MNATELADELDAILKAVGLTDNRVPTMIRQQQAEIEALKKDNKELHAIAQRMAMAESDARKSLQWFKDAQEKQNKPVAWMSVEPNGRTVLATYEFETAIPLYTHPAKTLTDDEIEEVYKAVEQDFALTESKKPDGGWRNFPIELARAILRKAQEK